MQILFFIAPYILDFLILILGFLAANEGKRLNIAGMSQISLGFILMILGRIGTIAFNYYIFVFHAYMGPALSLFSLINYAFGLIGLLLIVLGVREMVSAYREYLQQPR